MAGYPEAGAQNMIPLAVRLSLISLPSQWVAKQRVAARVRPPVPEQIAPAADAMADPSASGRAA
jgi:hypothetical protein